MEQVVKSLPAQASNPLSAILRRVLERLHAKNLVGSQLIAMSLVFGAVAMPIHAFDYANSHPQYVDGAVYIPVTTETTFQYPITTPMGVSQTFSKFHPGIDIRAPKGSEIVAIADGIVLQSSYSPTGFGKHVRLLHNDNVITLSAHMDKLLVKQGEAVVKGQAIGTVGMTGWTTGPHLHFEIFQDGKYLDPLSVIR